MRKRSSRLEICNKLRERTKSTMKREHFEYKLGSSKIKSMHRFWIYFSKVELSNQRIITWIVYKDNWDKERRREKVSKSSNNNIRNKLKS